MLNKELENTLNNAFKNARERNHEFMTVEHLLLALLENQTAADIHPRPDAVLSDIGVDN